MRSIIRLVRSSTSGPSAIIFVMALASNSVMDWSRSAAYTRNFRNKSSGRLIVMFL